MLPPLKGTVFAQRDITEQGASDYVLIVGAGDHRGYYAVDDFEHGEGVVLFFKNLEGKQKLVYACKTDGSWNLISRDCLEQLTEEQSARLHEDDRKANEALVKELRPEFAAAAEAYNRGVLAEMGKMDKQDIKEFPTHPSGEAIGNYR